MTRWIVGSSLKFRLLVLAAAAATVALGISQLRSMPVDVLPEYVPPTVEVQTEALGLSAAEVEQLVTVPLEADLLNGVAFLKDIRSESIAGLSRILLVFEPGTDLYRARQVVGERVAESHVALSGVSRPSQMLQPLSSTNRVMMVALATETLSPIEMSVLARWTIVPRLTGVPGVASVSIWGHRDRQIQVQVDPERLAERKVTLGQVVETAGNALWVSPLSFVEASTPGTGGFIDTANQRLPVQHISPLSTPDDLAQVRLEGTKGLRLDDVASVVEGHQPLIGDAVVGDGEGLLLVVEKFPEANTLDVTRGVEEAIDTMRPGLGGVQFDTNVYRPASYIDESIGNVALVAVIGAGLLVLLLVGFLTDWRSALVALVTISIAVVLGALVLDLLGQTMNALVLAGLVAALLLVTHEAIVGAENIARRLRGAREDSAAAAAAEVVEDATLEVRPAAVYGGLIVAVAVIPLLFLEGAAGVFFSPIAVAFLIALGASMLVALAVAPALSLLLATKGPRRRVAGGSRTVEWLGTRYRRALGWTVERPRIVYLAAGVVLVAGVVAVPFLAQSLLPTFKERHLLVRWQGAPGTSLPAMNRIMGRASRELRSIEGVEDVGADVGRAVLSDQAVGANSAEMWVSIDPDADYEETVAAVEGAVGAYPGLAGSVRTFSNDRVEEALSASENDLAVRVYGEDLRVLEAKAAEIRRAVADVEGLVDERVELPAAEPTLEVKADLLAAQRHRVKPGDVRRAAATLVSGIGVGSLFEEQKVFDVVVWGTPDNRNSLDAVRRLLIDTPTGGHVRLGQVADVRIGPSPAVIERHAVSRYVDVLGNVEGRGRDAVLDDLEEAVATVAFPLEFHAEIIAADRQPAGRLIALGVAGALAIFLLLQTAFGAWRRAAVAFLALPVAVAGGVLALLVDGGQLSFGSYLGLLAVFGLAVRNTVLLIDHNRRLEEGREATFGREVVLRGASDQLGLMLVTILAAVALFLPVLVFGDRAGLEVLRPLAVVVIGGVVTTAFANLFVVPAMYMRVGVARFDPTTRQLDA
jgi:Cu/Ag efflux pump CusA